MLFIQHDAAGYLVSNGSSSKTFNMYKVPFYTPHGCCPGANLSHESLGQLGRYKGGKVAGARAVTSGIIIYMLAMLCCHTTLQLQVPSWEGYLMQVS